jgi:hypothetical protein
MRSKSRGFSNQNNQSSLSARSSSNGRSMQARHSSRLEMAYGQPAVSSASQLVRLRRTGRMIRQDLLCLRYSTANPMQEHPFASGGIARSRSRQSSSSASRKKIQSPRAIRRAAFRAAAGPPCDLPIYSQWNPRNRAPLSRARARLSSVEPSSTIMTWTCERWAEAMHPRDARVRSMVADELNIGIMMLSRIEDPHLTDSAVAVSPRRSLR